MCFSLFSMAFWTKSQPTRKTQGPGMQPFDRDPRVLSPLDPRSPPPSADAPRTHTPALAPPSATPVAAATGGGDGVGTGVGTGGENAAATGGMALLGAAAHPPRVMDVMDAGPHTTLHPPGPPSTSRLYSALDAQVVPAPWVVGSAPPVAVESVPRPFSLSGGAFPDLGFGPASGTGDAWRPAGRQEGLHAASSTRDGGVAPVPGLPSSAAPTHLLPDRAPPAPEW